VGLSLNANGVLSGTPSASGTFNIGFQVADSTLPKLTATKTLQLAISGGNSTLVISTTALPAGMSGTGYNASLAATGGTAPYKWSIASGQLPAGLQFSSTGAISGTPSATGLFNFTTKASDSSGTVQTATAALSINVAGASNSGTGGSCGPTFNSLASSYTANDVYVPSNYQSAGSPSVSNVQTDPQFGCNYWKVADNSVHEYSAMAVIDSNDRWVVTIPTASTGITGPAVIRDLNTGSPICTVSGVGQGMRWGINDPNVLWYPNAQDNNLYVYYVTAHNGPAGSQPACTMVLFDTQTSTAFKGHQMTNCFGESDVASMNGSDVLCLSGSANDDTYGATVRRYNTGAKTLSPALSGTNASGTGTSYYFGTQCNDYGDMTYVSGNILVVYNGMTVASGCTVRDVAPHNYGGVDVFDGATGKYIRTVQTFGCGHGARGVDTDGSEIIACNNNWMDPNPPAGCDNGIVKTRISDSSQSCLLSYAHNLPPFPGGTPDVLREQLTSIHNNGGRHFNLLVSYTDNRGEAGDPPPPLGTAYRGPNNDTALSSNWSSQWGVVMNELVLVPLTNTQSSHHLVHHHNFWVGSGGVQYWSDAHGSMSRSGNYAVFDSSFGNTWPNLGVYVVKIQ
jgi:hypothetical protein